MSDEKKPDLPDTQPTEVATTTKPLPVQKDAATASVETEVVEPVPGPEVAAETEEPVVVVVDAPKKKRRRWPWVLGIILLVLAILLTIAFFVAEAYAKDYARDYIKQRIIAVLGIEPGTPVTVDIGDGSVLLQALRGKLDQIDVTADQVSFGILKGAATVHAEGVPLDQNAPVGTLGITFAVAEGDVAALAGNLSGMQLDSISLEEPEIIATTTFSFFGFQLPVGMGIEPSADKGQIVFTPTSIKLGNDTYTAEQLKQTFGAFAGQLLKQQSFCVAENLPAALTIVDVDVVKKDLIVKINGDGAALGGPDLSTPGTCAG
jgi:LmeA-like phospholipid-binding